MYSKKLKLGPVEAPDHGDQVHDATNQLHLPSDIHTESCSFKLCLRVDKNEGNNPCYYNSNWSVASQMQQFEKQTWGRQNVSNRKVWKHYKTISCHSVDKSRMLKNFSLDKINSTKNALFVPLWDQLITILLLIFNSCMSWSTSFVSLKLFVGFSIFDSISFLLKFIFLFEKIHGPFKT